MLIRDKLTVFEVAELEFNEYDSKLHFKNYRGMTVMKMHIPDINKVLAGKVIDIILSINHREGFVNVSKISEIASNLDKLEEELIHLNERQEVTYLENIQQIDEQNSEKEEPPIVIANIKPLQKEEHKPVDTPQDTDDADINQQLQGKETIDEVYGLYVWFKVNDIDFEDKLKHAKVVEIDRLLNLFEIETSKHASRGAKAKLIVEKLKAHTTKQD